MSERSKLIDEFESVTNRAVPSQIPVRVFVESFNRMAAHCKQNNQGVWGCRKNGAWVKAKLFSAVRIYDRDTGLFQGVTPVAWLYCSGCDKEPKNKGGSTLWADQIQTLSL